MAGTMVPKSVRFIVDDKGEKTGVVIDLKSNAELSRNGGESTGPRADSECSRRSARTRSRSRVSGYPRMIEEHIELAHYLHHRVSETPDLGAMAPPGLSRAVKDREGPFP